ncbi:MAG TPA: glycoside hydrolase domain-containing protein [Candidatus Acidoferrales bacterium]|nr:glycoside hydrolase domain-containing protein [Candidatus Acidoferrales bacterium]
MGRAVLLFVAAIACSWSMTATAPAQEKLGARAYLGFDANDYPGDAALPRLRQAFTFAGYWLNNPPGTPAGKTRTESDTWLGHRAALAQQGFGFLVLFNGRLDRELKPAATASTMGANDARAAAGTAKREGFPSGTVIFIDQEEGGSMDAAQMAYLVAWFDGVTAAGFRAGIYCSGMPSKEGDEVVLTASYVRENTGGREIVYFVYNDQCPPSPGCVHPANPPLPRTSGVAFAVAWQFAQSPRRRKLTRTCSTTYNRDGNCYAPGLGPGSPLIDIDTATSPDPSDTR